MNAPYIRRPMTGHGRFITPQPYGTRPPVLSDTRARPAREGER